MLAASHTHAGPAVSSLRGMGAAPRAYFRRLERRIVECAAEASKTAVAAEIGIGATELRGNSIIREGPGRNSGARDSELKILKVVKSGTGEPLCVLYNFTCHPVTLGSTNYLISPDYPGAARRCLAERGWEALFLQGACGDINPAGCSWDDPNRQRSNPDRPEELGRTVGAAVATLLEKTGVTASAALGAAAFETRVPTRKPRPEQLVSGALRSQPPKPYEVSDRPRRPRSTMQKVRTRWARQMAALIQKGRYPETIPVPVQILRIGDALIVGVAAELFSQIGLDIKRSLGPARTFVSAYTNGCVGYVASEESYRTAEYATAKSAAGYGIPMLAANAGATLTEQILEAARQP
jgi:hypothetical protein